MNTRNFVGCIVLLIIIFFPCDLLAQNENSLPDKLVVVTLDIPPYTIKTADERWEGLGIDLWRAVAYATGRGIRRA